MPENTVKFGVGVMLTSFGIFWTSEGAGIDWPGGDASLLLVIAFVVGVSLALVALVDRSMGARRDHIGRGHAVKWLGGFAKFWYDFIVGDDWRLAICVVVMVAVVTSPRTPRRGLVVASAGRGGRASRGVDHCELRRAQSPK